VSTLVEFPLAAGGSVVVAVDDAPDLHAFEGEVTRSMRPSDVAAQAGQTFEEALSRIKGLAEAVVGELRSAGSPDEIEVEFGVQMSADVGAIVAKLSGQANFRVALRWKRDEPPASG
jgi:hypothetical protein